MKHTLEVYLSEKIIFYNDGKWLHPLLELEIFLSKKKCDRSKILVKDKIIGRAAALILIYLGVQNVEAGIISKPGKDALEKHAINYKYIKIVERIQCRTEKMLENEYDPEKAFYIIKQLAKDAKLVSN